MRNLATSFGHLIGNNPAFALMDFPVINRINSHILQYEGDLTQGLTITNGSQPNPPNPTPTPVINTHRLRYIATSDDDADTEGLHTVLDVRNASNIMQIPNDSLGLMNFAYTCRVVGTNGDGLAGTVLCGFQTDGTNLTGSVPHSYYVYLNDEGDIQIWNDDGTIFAEEAVKFTTGVNVIHYVKISFLGTILTVSVDGNDLVEDFGEPIISDVYCSSAHGEASLTMQTSDFIIHDNRIRVLFVDSLGAGVGADGFAIIDAAGLVQKITVTHGGKGYTQANLTVSLQDDGSGVNLAFTDPTETAGVLAVGDITPSNKGSGYIGIDTGIPPDIRFYNWVKTRDGEINPASDKWIESGSVQLGDAALQLADALATTRAKSDAVDQIVGFVHQDKTDFLADYPNVDAATKIEVINMLLVNLQDQNTKDLLIKIGLDISDEKAETGGGSAEVLTQLLPNPITGSTNFSFEFFMKADGTKMDLDDLDFGNAFRTWLRTDT